MSRHRPAPRPNCTVLPRPIRLARAVPLVAVLCTLAGCGGGDGGVANLPPAPAPSSAPAPAPTGTPTSGSGPTATVISAETFRTSEYYRSDGPDFHSAIPAWQTGASGRGVTLGIVDTGIDTANPELASRISAASRDVAAARGLNGTDHHGTQVALVAAGARDGVGIMGIAYDATILMARADDPGSCGSIGGCAFSDPAIASGIDLAVRNGARVINLSLGGSGADNSVVQAAARASAAGAVIVVSAGNGSGANPTSFATILRQAGAGNVIVAGSVNNQGVISGFSNRAGREANWYLSALGEQICCVYEGGQIKVTNDNTGQTFVTVVSGTSFAAPQIAGAAALLIQAFPNLTAAQVVDLLLSSAREAGTAGTDPTYGRGILNIAGAFAARGTTTVAGTGAVLVPGETSLITSAAMGDALRTASLQTTVLDAYQRAYSVDLTRGLHGTAVNPRLGPALLAATRPAAFGNGAMSLAFTAGAVPGGGWSGPLRLAHDQVVAARVLAGRIAARLAPGIDLALGLGEGVEGIAAGLRGARQPAFLLTGAAADDLGFARSEIMAAAVRQRLGASGVSLTVMGDSGRLAIGSAAGALPAATAPAAALDRAAPRVARLGLALDRQFGAISATAAASWLAEDQSLLGARLAPGLGSRGADTLFVDLAAAWQPSARWSLVGQWRQGRTRARAAGMVQGARLASSAWNLDLVRHGFFTPHDALALRVAQSLRIDRGSLALRMPVYWDYATRQATLADQRIALTPSGRELAAELGWSGPLWGGAASTALFWRHAPGHLSGLPDESGAALRWRVEF